MPRTLKFAEPPGIVKLPPQACGQKKLSVLAVPADRTTRITLRTWLKSISGLFDASTCAAAFEMTACAKAFPFLGANELDGHGEGITSNWPAQLSLIDASGKLVPWSASVRVPCATSS